MAQGPGTRVIEERDRGVRTVDGVVVRITELVWNDIDGRSFDVYLGFDDTNLTEEGSFDEMPEDDDISYLIDILREECDHAQYEFSFDKKGQEHCARCGQLILRCPYCVQWRTDNDLILDHIIGTHGR